jgi:hypothetical protein
LLADVTQGELALDEYTKLRNINFLVTRYPKKQPKTLSSSLLGLGRLESSKFNNSIIKELKRQNFIGSESFSLYLCRIVGCSSSII